MARTLTYTCDGCGKSETHGIDARSSDVEIHGVGIQIGGCGNEGRDNGRDDVDLCAACRRHLVNLVNPRHWPRIERSCGND